MRKNIKKPTARSKLIARLLWRRHGTELTAYASGLCYDQHSFMTKDDLLSEFILRLSSEAEGVISKPKEIRIHYLKRMMKNLYFDGLQRERRRCEVMDELPVVEEFEQTDEEFFMQNDSFKSLLQICERIVGPGNARIIELHCQGFLYKEIATMLGRSEASVRTASSRATKLIREELGVEID